MTNRRILLIGPSGSGKTTLAQELSAQLKLPVVSLDDFRAKSYPGGKFPQANAGRRQYRNYEHPCCWDTPAITSKLWAMVNRGDGFIAEGNHLLFYPQIAAIPCERYYLDVSFETSIERRKSRHRYLPADISFAAIGRQETARWVEPQKLQQGVVILDGRNPTAHLLATIMLLDIPQAAAVTR